MPSFSRSRVPRLVQVNPQFYAFRWITLLLTQEFSFPDSVRLWDTLFSDAAGRYDCLLRFCCAMLINVREELLKVANYPLVILPYVHGAQKHFAVPCFLSKPDCRQKLCPGQKCSGITRFSRVSNSRFRYLGQHTELCEVARAG